MALYQNLWVALGKGKTFQSSPKIIVSMNKLLIPRDSANQV